MINSQTFILNHQSREYLEANVYAKKSEISAQEGCHLLAKLPKKSSSILTFVILTRKNKMDLSGKIINQLPEVGGNSKTGNAWRKQEFILETGGQYPKKVCVSLWGDKIDQFALKVGEQVTLGIDVESREYNGRWYTEVKAYKVDRSGGGSMTPPPMVDDYIPESEEDRLPF